METEFLSYVVGAEEGKLFKSWKLQYHIILDLTTAKAVDFLYFFSHIL